MKYWKYLLALTLAGASWQLPAAAPTYTFAVVPQQAAAQLARIWSPLLAWVGTRSGVKLRFATAPDIPEFEKRLARGEYDFAYMNPYHYTVFSQTPGYRAFAKEKNRRIKGILVVHKDSPIMSIADLSGATLVFPSPAAFAASILPRGELQRAGIDFTPKYVSSHDSVYINVAKTLFVAGGGIPRTLAMTDTDVGKELRVLWQTKGYTPHAIAAHPRVPDKVMEHVRDALLGMNTDTRGQSLLGGIGFKAGIAPVEQTDWADVRELELALLSHPVN